ncbi:MAG: arylsulfotransferase family protein [Geminicoccaceae bacterium]
MVGSSGNLGRNLYIGVCFVAVAVLAFVAGSVATLSEAPPARIVEDAYRAGTALYSKATQYNDPLLFDLWRNERTKATGVTKYVPDKAQNGLTVYTGGQDQKVRLIDMQGNVIREWGLPYSRIWDETAAVKAPQPDSHVYIEKSHLYPNGDMLALYVAVGDTPWGYGLVKFDKDNNVLWKYLAHVHHDLTVAPDGRIFVLTQEIGQDDLPQYAHLKAPRIDDYIAVLSPDGRELKKVRIIDSLLRSPSARLLDTVPWYIQKGAGDYLHTNSIEYLDGTSAQKLPEAREGRLLLSFREIGTLAIFDPTTDEITWTMRGAWLRQHDPDLLANGNILLFDNQGNVGPGGITRVIEVDPKTHKIVWTYAGTPEEPFESEVRSSQARLPNGNTLITESDGGRLFEVTRAGEIVWNYINPVRGQRSDGQTVIPIVSWAERVDPQQLDPSVLARPTRVATRIGGNPPATN